MLATVIVRSFIDPSVTRTTYSYNYLFVRLGLSIPPIVRRYVTMISKPILYPFLLVAFFTCSARQRDYVSAVFVRRDEGSVAAISHCWIIAIYKLSYRSVTCRNKIVCRKNLGHGKRYGKGRHRKKERERERDIAIMLSISRLQQIRVLTMFYTRDIPANRWKSIFFRFTLFFCFFFFIFL